MSVHCNSFKVPCLESHDSIGEGKLSAEQRHRGGQGKTEAKRILWVASLYSKAGGLNVILAQHAMHDFTCRLTVG